MKLRLGFVRLCDAAPLVVARELGLFRAEGLGVDLVPMASWAETRDRLITGDVDGAHCLAALPLAMAAGLYGREPGLVTAFTLNHFGNAITVSPAVAEAGTELPTLARVRREQGRPLTLAAVFPLSKHHYELREWLIRQGVDPENDVRIVVVPPALVARGLQRGSLDGFCVGEPWNTRAILEGCGIAVATSQSLGLPGTEKVLAVRPEWLESPGHAAVLRALSGASRWLAEAGNRLAAAELLAPYLGRPPEELVPALTGRFRAHARAASGAPREFVRFDGLNCPDTAHGEWYLRQMQAAGQLPHTISPAEIAARAFRADVHRRVLTESAVH